MNIYGPEYKVYSKDNKVANFSVKYLNKAIDNKYIIVAYVEKCTITNSLVLNLGKNIKGIVDFEDIEFKFDGKASTEKAATTKVGKFVKVIPTSIVDNSDGTYTVQCSRKLAQIRCKHKYLDNLKSGDIIDAKVAGIAPYGVFCDIGCGITSLLPINYICVPHIVDIYSELYGVHTLRVIVKDRDELGRIRLTHKELLGTWKEEVDRLHIGNDDILLGEVVNKTSSGVFVRISQNLTALAPENNLDLEVGDLVHIRIRSINTELMKIKVYILDKIDNQAKIVRVYRYSFNDVKHIDSWKYSTDKSEKVIETVFNEEETI